MTDEQILNTEYSFHFDELRYSLIAKEKISPTFDDLRKKMMIMSFYKYGPMRDNYNKHKCMDAIGNIRKRLAKYLETKNTEFLADIANFAMIEYMFPSIPGTKRSFDPIKASRDPDISKTIEACINSYKETKDCMYLVLLANCSAKEFSSPALEGAYYKPTDSGACELAGFGIKQLQDEMEEEENRTLQRFL